MAHSSRTEFVCILTLALATACSDAEDDTGRGPPGASTGSMFDGVDSYTNSGSARVVINEVLTGASDHSSDWIELFNAGADSVNLTGWRLTDDALAHPGEAWSVPTGTWIAPDGYLIVYASDGEGDEMDGVHASFKCSKGGETLVLYDPNAHRADWIDVASMDDDQAYARIFDAAVDWIVTDEPTKGTAN